MTASQNPNLTVTALREALGPGFGFAGPSERLLWTATCPQTGGTGGLRSRTYGVAG